MGDSQRGFRPGGSCPTNQLCYNEGVKRQVDKGESVDAVYLDWQGPSDMVPHERPFAKLKIPGMGGSVPLCIVNRLEDMKLRVVLNGQVPQWGKVNSGVPPGSVLGLLLPQIVLNGLEGGVTGEVNRYAHDTQQCQVAETHRDCGYMQEDPDKLGDCASEWQMRDNVVRCRDMHLGRPNPNYGVMMLGPTFGATTQGDVVGVIADTIFIPLAHSAAAAKLS